MIRNIVFDLGGVLLAFNPEQYLAERYRDPDLCRRLFEAVFLSDLWIALDRGTVTVSKARQILHRRHPALKKEIDQIFDGWESILTPIEGSIAILRELKSAGYRLFALSNFHRAAFQKVYRHYDFFQLFDGLVISARIKLIKPEPEIYRYLLKRYHLEAKGSLFIDDRELNLTPARAMGFETIHFTGSRALRQALAGLKIL